MKRLTSTAAAVLAGAMAACTAAAAPLTTLHAIHTLTNAEAGKGLQVAFEGTITYYNPKDIDMFVQDGDEAIYVQAARGLSLARGDRVLVTGHSGVYFRPDVIEDNVTLLRHGPVPKPVRATFDQMIRAELFCRLVTVRGVIHSADIVVDGDLHTINLRILMAGGYVDAYVISDDESATKNFLDADVEITAVVPLNFDNKMQLTGILLEIPSLADIKILQRGSASPWSLPVTPMDEILAGYRLQNLTERVHVQGTITYYQPGSAAVLQSGAKSLWILTQTRTPLRIGDLADATGFPDVHDGFLTLTMGEIQDSLAPAPVAPRHETWSELASGHSAFDLVSTEGKVVTEVRAAARDEYVLDAHGQLFSAIYNHPAAVGNLKPLPMKPVAAGSKVRVTGICILHSSDTFHGPVTFDVLLRDFDDVAVVARPSPLSVRNLVILVVLLLVLLLLAGVRGWVMERKVRRQNAAAAEIERRRSHILEDINGSRPLSEIVEEITGLVSFRLRGVPCWCQIVNGARLGNCPANVDSLRIVQEQIPARSGPPLGTILAAFDPRTRPRAVDSESLSTAAALAALAIETRRLYSDLVHRSEFDLLTDIHNRFSLEKYLDQQIDQARQEARVLGLIYIDLNDFKQVNDLYGHQVGDLYLQEVATRMKKQLRGVDMLARLGGDEFAVLLTRVRNRAEVEEISLRLERCFDKPFAAERCFVHGSASVGIALYPEDGSTRDLLLSAGDAAMYVNKQVRREKAGGRASHSNPRPSREEGE